MSKFVDLLTDYIDNLQVEGNFATGKIDTDEKFADFRIALKNFGYSFTIRSSRKEYHGRKGKNGKVKIEENKHGDESLDKKEKRLPGRGSLMFKSSSDVSVPFFGLPFTVETTTYFTCSQGIKYYGSKQYPDEMFREGDPLSKKRRRPKITQKIGCQARMTVKKIKVFTNEDYVVSKDNWREKKMAIDQLKKDFLESKKIESINRYCVVISLDTSHNHEAKIKIPKRPKQSQVDPARKVLKLHEQFQDALVMLNSELITKCTNISILTSCCNSLKTIINQMKDSIERKDGVPTELITAAINKKTQKKTKTDKMIKREPGGEGAGGGGGGGGGVSGVGGEVGAVGVAVVGGGGAGAGTGTGTGTGTGGGGGVGVNVGVGVVGGGDGGGGGGGGGGGVGVGVSSVVTKMENGEDNQVIELSNIIEGTQVIWDPVNVSWVQDGQIIVQEAAAAATTAAAGGAANHRGGKETQSILLQRRAEDVAVSNSVSDQNIGVITQNGQNYTILQHGANVHLPNIGVSVPLTMAKVVHPTAILTSAGMKKASKRSDVGVTAIAIPAGVDWNQQNWGQITQVVSGDGQFANFPTQTIWNITQ